MTKINRLYLSAAALVFAACAAPVVKRPVTVSGARDTKVAPKIVFAKTVTARSNAKIESSIEAGSVWEYYGSIPQGAVYKSRDSVLTVEGANISEAYPVVSGEYWNGFYLPVEKAYSPAEKPVKLPLKP